MDGDASLVRASAAISVVTLAARLVGFARWIALGAAVGTTYLGNVYQTANLIPNVAFELIAGGLLASVLVPVFVRELDGGTERVSVVASTLVNVLLLVAVPVVVVGLVLRRQIIAAMLSGVADPAVRAEQVELGSWFLLFFLPQVPLYLVGMVMQGALHAHRKFVVPALAPLLSSVTVIATYLVFRATGPTPDLGSVSRGRLVVLAGGTTLGVVVLTLSQLPLVLRLGLRWRPVLSLRDPSVRRAVRSGAWGAVFVAAAQAFLLVAVALANRVEGGVVAFQIANAFFELPNAIVGLPVAVAAYPALAAAFAARDESRFGELLSGAWRMAAFAGAPAAAVLLVLAGPASSALLGWAPHVDAGLVASTLAALALGVPGWVLLSTAVRALYARGATARAAVVNASALVVLVAAGGVAVVTTGLRGEYGMRLLGLSVAGGWTVAAVVAEVMLARQSGAWPVPGDMRVLAAGLARAGVVGAASYAAVRALAATPAAAQLAGGLAAAGVCFAGLAARSTEARRTVALLRGTPRASS